MQPIRLSASKALFSPKNIAYMALFSALTAICSWISIPTLVPFTLQTFAIFLMVGLLGTKRSLLSILIYLLLGAIGLPVFAGFSGGLGILFGATGGYLIGFFFLVLTAGLIINRFGHSFPILIAAFFCGLLVCYCFGTAWFLIVYARNTGPIGLGTALSWCVIPFLLPDTIKIVLAALAAKRLWQHF